MGKRILRYTRAAISTQKRQKQIPQLDIKKRKNPPMKKRTKNRIADVREKRARFAKRFSANGPFRTAAILPFQAVCFYTRRMLVSARRSLDDLFKTSIRLSAKVVKYINCCQAYPNIDILCKQGYYMRAINLINLGKDLYFGNRCIFRITQLS